MAWYIAKLFWDTVVAVVLLWLDIYVMKYRLTERAFYMAVFLKGAQSEIKLGHVFYKLWVQNYLATGEIFQIEKQGIVKDKIGYI